MMNHRACLWVRNACGRGSGGAVRTLGEDDEEHLEAGEETQRRRSVLAFRVEV